MDDMRRYLDASTRANTVRSYQSALRHFEVDWGGYLPATPDSVARYLTAYASQLSINTLKQRLAALAHWHAEQGFADPTQAPFVKKVLRGIRALHPAIERHAVPLQLTELGTVADWLATAARQAERCADGPRALRWTRDRALILLGFWRGFRADELTRLRIEHIQVHPGEGLTLFLPSSKTDRENRGRTWRVPALARWCPVEATQAWIAASGRAQGPLFCGISRWGGLNAAPLDVDSVVPLLRRALARAGTTQAHTYSGHSLRRGFAHWATANGWDLKSLMAYVGWRRADTAMRYMDGDTPPFVLAAGPAQTLAADPPPAPSAGATAPTLRDIIVQFALTSYTQRARQRAKARRLIEEACLARHGAQREDADGYGFRVRIPDGPDLDEVIATVLDDMYRIAGNHGCHLEVTLRDHIGSRHWV